MVTTYITVTTDLRSQTCCAWLQTALLKIGRMEDMDTQLRSQLEKIISQRNQLSAEKAASDIEVSTQHMVANCLMHNLCIREGCPHKHLKLLLSPSSKSVSMPHYA